MNNYTKPSRANGFDGIPDAVHLEHAPCPLGCTENDQALFGARDRIYNLPGRFNVVKCRACGLMRTSPRPSPDTIGYYYPDSYGPYHGTQIAHAAPARQSFMHRLARVLKRGLPSNIQRIPDLKPGRLLEIGCASGAFLQQMRGCGWQVEGIEMSSTAADAARAHGHAVYAGAVENAPDPARPYDLIVGWMVLEHLHDPAAVLRRLHGWAGPRAWLAISVPNAGALEFSWFTHRWYALQVPTHLFHFTPATIGKLLKRCGWQPRKIFHQRSVSNLLASCGLALQNRRCLARPAAWLRAFPEAPAHMHAAVYPLAWVLSGLGQTGRMTIWAQKGA